MGFLNGVSKPCQQQCGWTLGRTAAVSQGQEAMKVSLVGWKTVLSLEEKTVSGFCPQVVPLARFRWSFSCDKLSPGVYQLPASWFLVSFHPKGGPGGSWNCWWCQKYRKSYGEWALTLHLVNFARGGEMITFKMIKQLVKMSGNRLFNNPTFYLH